MLGYLIYLKHLIGDTIRDWDQEYTGTEVPDYVIQQGADQSYYYKFYYDHLYTDVYSVFERYYAWISVFDVPTALNSMVNPIIYYWRMKPFRVFVHNQLQELTSSHSDQQMRNDNTANGASSRDRVSSKIWKGVHSVASPTGRSAKRTAHFRNTCQECERSEDVISSV